MTATQVRRHRHDDDVDRIVEALVADPSRAEDAKRLLKQKIAAPDQLAVLRAPTSKGRARVRDADADDPWDNVPV